MDFKIGDKVRFMGDTGYGHIKYINGPRTHVDIEYILIPLFAVDIREIEREPQPKMFRRPRPGWK